MLRVLSKVLNDMKIRPKLANAYRINRIKKTNSSQLFTIFVTFLRTKLKSSLRRHFINCQVMDLLSGKTLYCANGSSVSADVALANKKVILFYFSAHWCPPCRAFTPVLKDFYDEVADDAGIEVIFVSSDRSVEDMNNYMKESHGAWLATEHGSDLTQALKQKYSISGIPALIVIRKSDGQLITKDGRGAVQGKGPLAVKDWN